MARLIGADKSVLHMCNYMSVVCTAGVKRKRSTEISKNRTISTAGPSTRTIEEYTAKSSSIKHQS